MSTSYVPYQLDRLYLLSCALQEWLPQGHLAYFISKTIDSLNLSAFHARYAGGGSRNQPFHPAIMVKVLVYAYASPSCNRLCGAHKVSSGESPIGLLPIKPCVAL